MACLAPTSAIGRIATAACIGLLAATPLAIAEPDRCPPTITEIRLPTTRPARCIAVRMERATIVLDMSLLRADANSEAMTPAGDRPVSRWTMLRAKELLQAAPAAAVGADCAIVDVDLRAPQTWLYYVTSQIDSGNAVVYAAGSDTAAPVITVRDRPNCSQTLGGIGTRVYFLPGGRWFLPRISSVS